MSYKVGITGGIGAGKSLICKLFSLLGIPIYYADDRAKSLLESDKLLIKEIKKYFGDAMYSKEGILDRKSLASIVFKDYTQLDILNKLVHPAVVRDYESWEKQNSDSLYTLREAAIMFESNTYKDLDKIILVDAPIELRIERIQKRDNRPIDEIKAIVERQWTSEQKLKLSHFIINNDEENMVIPQVLDIHNKIIAHINA
jgi:dephospho-CoA kinase